MENLKSRSTLTNHKQKLIVNRDLQEVQISCMVIKYIDKDTLQHVIYLASLDLSSYGNTFNKAKKMLDASLLEYCSYLLNLTPTNLVSELTKLGWKHRQNQLKNFSNSFVDMDGNLNDFNALNNKIELSNLIMKV